MNTNQKGSLLFVAEGIDACFCPELLLALRKEGFEVVSLNQPSQLVQRINQGGISLIVVFGDGQRMFRAQMAELEVAENAIPVIYLSMQTPEEGWPGFVTFYPWPCVPVTATLTAVIQIARQRCLILSEPSTRLY